MFYAQNAGYTDRYMRTVSFLIKYDWKLIDSIQAPGPVSPVEDWEDVQEPKPKKRRYTHRKVISALPKDLFDGDDGYEAAVSSVPERSHFTLFTEALVTAGTIQWRRHSQEGDTVVLSDYCSTSGKLKPLDYVHVEASYADPDNMLLTCTCKIYKYMEGRALRKMHLESSEDAVLDSNFTCMHCRFFKEFLHPIKDNFGDQDRSSAIYQKVQSSLEALNNPIALLGEATTAHTTKFSVVGQTNTHLALVHMHFGPQGCFTRCMNSLCQVNFHSKSKLPQGLTLDQLKKKKKAKSLCDHLHTFFSNSEMLVELFPSFFGSEEEDEELALAEDEFPDRLPAELADEVNNDDHDCKDYESGYVFFDPSAETKDKEGRERTGKWRCKSYSQYRPQYDRFHPDLVQSASCRLQYMQGELIDGFYRGPALKALPEGNCECGAGYDLQCTELIRKAKVYSRQVSAHSYTHKTLSY